LKEQLVKLSALTDQPFAINNTFLSGPIAQEVIAAMLEARPRLITFALGDPGDYVNRVHDAGILVMHQVTTVQQAYQAAERGVDIIVAQGSEAGGYSGVVAGLVLIPQVVDAVRPIPVIAAGGIADGRGLAVALVLGAQGVNIGTRFLASNEAPIDPGWKQAILSAESQDALKMEVWNDIFPPRDPDHITTPRVLRSPFVDQWLSQRDAARQEAERLRVEIRDAIADGRFGELFPFTGQTAGMIHDILPAGEIVHGLVAEAEGVLKKVGEMYRTEPA
jgi:nitronate monooxygenase/enoyl-[acyl-carrier protein] reductase II